MNTSLHQNFAVLDGLKEQVIECELCQIEKNYVLTNCGHTFCHSCYQVMCTLEPEERFCPWCQTPFTFESIVKISWSSEKISDDDDD